MKNLFRKSLLLIATSAALLAAPGVALAESMLNSGVGPRTATARLNFSVVVDRFVYLRVGSGTAMVSNTTIDTVSWAITPAVNGLGGAIAGTGSPILAEVKGNVGALTLANSAAAATNGVQTIAMTKFDSVVVGAGAPPHGLFNSSSAITATNGIVNMSGNWSYSYLNDAVIAAGTYTTQVTYTLTSL